MTAVAERMLIYGGYAVVFVTIAAYSAFVIRRGRQLAAEVEDDEKYWS